MTQTSGQQGQTGQKKYTVARPFKDRSGKQWEQGQEYQGTDQNETENQVSQGNLTEKQG